MSRLSDTLQRTLDECRISAAALERKAELPPMSIKNIFNGAHPRPERFDRLIQAIPLTDNRCELLIAYTLDDCPPSLVTAMETVLRGHLYIALQQLLSDTEQISAVREAISPSTRPTSTATKARQVLTAMAARLDAGDTLLADWLADTGELLTTAHLPATTEA